MEREHYPTDLTDAQWEMIDGLLPPPASRGRPREVSRRDVVNAVLYVNRTGCQWRALPHDFPHWKTVYNIFWEWRTSGVWQASSMLIYLEGAHHHATECVRWPSLRLYRTASKTEPKLQLADEQWLLMADLFP